MPPEDSVTVAKSRIEKLIVALSCASYDRSDHPEAQLDPQEGDDLGMLEGILQLFIDELALAKDRAVRALEDSERARVLLESRLATIHSQQDTISQLSTPIIDVWQGVLTLPLVGILDSQRAQDITERLLTRVTQSEAHTVLVDLTGIDVVDGATADHLGKLARGLKMLGSQCIFTGFKPALAHTLVTLDVDLGGVRTMQTLEDGLRACIDGFDAEAS